MSRILNQTLEHILSYIHLGYDSSKISDIVYIFDNNVLSNLAFSARTYPEEFYLLLEGMELRETTILIPEIIMEESARNEKMTPIIYRDYYAPLFKALSHNTDIYIVPFESIYWLIESGAANSTQAFLQFKIVAKLLNKVNLEIKDNIEKATDIEAIKHALTTNRKDAGERVIHLLTSALLIDGVRKVKVYSNEKRGVYNIRYICSQDETLREILRFETQDAFLKCYELHSFDCILANVLKLQKGRWTRNEHIEFINRHRIKNMKNRDVHYFISPNLVEKRHLENYELVDLILNNNDVIIAF